MASPTLSHNESETRKPTRKSRFYANGPAPQPTPQAEIIRMVTYHISTDVTRLQHDLVSVVEDNRTRHAEIRRLTNHLRRAQSVIQQVPISKVNTNEDLFYQMLLSTKTIFYNQFEVLQPVSITFSLTLVPLEFLLRLNKQMNFKR